MNERYSQTVEEADIELCASGFDNILMHADPIEELKTYHDILGKIGAQKTAKVINELVEWVSSDPTREPLDISLSDQKRNHNLWTRYNDCSCDENPQELAIRYEQNEK